MIKQFETIDISGDAGIRAFGRDLPELFANAGTGMYSLITDLKDIGEAATARGDSAKRNLEGLIIADHAGNYSGSQPNSLSLPRGLGPYPCFKRASLTLASAGSR